MRQGPEAIAATNDPGPVVFTNKARCRDCYRCVRICPVKAIRVVDGQAAVDPNRCIACGSCVRECPQGAKSVRDDLHRARQLLAGPRPVAISVAPSFAGFFEDWECERLPSVLRQLGFKHVAETASGAWHVAQATARHVQEYPGRTHLCSSCPAFVRYVERYCPAASERLVPVVSPMLAHARLIREQLGSDFAVVFVGPCVAKKVEADQSRAEFHVDCALTFNDLRRWLGEEGLDLASCEESRFDETPGGSARLFPIEGGSLKTADLVCDLTSDESVVISGAEEIKTALATPFPPEVKLVEALFCPQGCIQGPAGGSKDSLGMVARQRVLAYAAARGPGETPASHILLAATYPSHPVPEGRFSEESIRAVLARSGKTTAEDELNCGACGYDSCRAKAIAVLQGLAEPEMCIPFMRLQAERRSDRIMESSPNGIVILDSRLHILGLNPSMKRLFACSDALLGQHISRLLDPQPFEDALARRQGTIDGVVRSERYGIVYRHLIYPLAEDEQVVGIFLNLTEGTQSREALEHLQAETVLQAQQLLDHQIHMAQTLTRLLGESTAQGETLVNKLVDLAASSSGAGRAAKDFDPWPTDTST